MAELHITTQASDQLGPFTLLRVSKKTTRMGCNGTELSARHPNIPILTERFSENSSGSETPLITMPVLGGGPDGQAEPEKLFGNRDFKKRLEGRMDAANPSGPQRAVKTAVATKVS
ncbi:MAG: hypothetical protein M1839_003976 [Geoglossum umbratile]|nr:MAG: hypothetical protein M1839_003976 [Geoglossum umbratile]